MKEMYGLKKKREKLNFWKKNVSVSINRNVAKDMH